MSHVKAQVEKLMRLDANFRNSDKALILQIWKDYGLELNSLQIDRFKMVPSADSILRRRRELSYKYPASEKVTKHRFKRFKQYHEEFSKQNFVIRLLRKHGI